MNSIRLYTLVYLFKTITALIYPCAYTDQTKYILRCDLCKCLSSSIYSTYNLCSITPLITCKNNTDDEFLNSKFNTYDNTNEKRIELYNFNSDILENEHICSINNLSNIKFINFISNRIGNKISKCFDDNLLSITFINSNINEYYFLSNKFLFYNTALNINYFNLTTTKFLLFHSVNFLSKPFQLTSLPLLTHLTITYTQDYDLIGSFPHLTYLNLCQTKLNDKQLNKILYQINVPDLTTLILSNNHLTMITNKFPSTIRYLDLSHNLIKLLDYYSFKSLYSLNLLNLSSNSPLTIQQDTFTRIPYLEILDLSYSLPLLLGDDLFLPLQKLRHLNISNNHLTLLPHLPIPYDAHIIESYEHHLPVLYVDISNNQIEIFNLDLYSSLSTQDKYILSLNITNNRIKTFEFPSLLFNDVKQRGPFIELDVNNNPLECDCHLYQTIYSLAKNDGFHKKRMNYNSSEISSTKDFYSLNPFHTILSDHLYKSKRFSSKPNRIKFLYMANLTCHDTIEPKLKRSLFQLDSSNTFCSYRIACPSKCSCCSLLNSSINCSCHIQCPNECTCKQSSNLLNNYVNCSSRQLKQIPNNIPYTATHLFLNDNQIKFIANNLTHLTNLKYLSLANNNLESIYYDELSTLTHMENLDLSSNSIKFIQSNTFSNMFHLGKVYLHDNPWIPKLSNRDHSFPTNLRLNLLTYGNGLSCNKSNIFSSYLIEKPLTVDDCCKNMNVESCQQLFPIEKTEYSSYDYDLSKPKTIFISLFHQKYILIGSSLLVFIVLCIVLFCIYRKGSSRFSHKKFLSNEDMKCQRKIPLDIRHEVDYSNKINNNSISYTDDDEYASIPLTVSQTDMIGITRSQTIIPPPPPPRHPTLHRPNSNSSTISTSITIPSTKSQNSSLIITTNSCLHIKLDVLVLYSINDSEYIHEHVGQQLESLYGKRFSFHFIHRDRMLGELDWLIENSCITILILCKPYNVMYDYMKILSSCSKLKTFIILINKECSQRVTSIKIREKLARLYQTTNIYQWNLSPNSLIHEQLELFLEQNCGSATYVTD